MLIQVKGLKKKFNENVVIDESSFTISHGDKVGIVGPNGGGKSTLLKLINGNITPDSGSITIFGRERIGYLSQERDEYYNNEERYTQTNTFSLLNNIPNIRFDALSGGEKTKMSLFDIFSVNPSLLLLDEPTNHLDTNSVKKIEDMLVNFTGTILVVSHDRFFLDSVANKILEIQDGQIKIYTGNYSQYKKIKQEIKLARNREYQKNKAYREKLEQAFIKRRDIALKSQDKANNLSRDAHRNAKAYKGASSKALMRNALSIKTRMEKIKIEKPENENEIQFRLNNSKKTGRFIIRIENLCFSYGDRRILDDVNFSLLKGDKVALIGDNGVGKTTLLELITSKRLSPTSGSITLAPVKCSYLSQTISTINYNNSVLDELLTVSSQQDQIGSYLNNMLFKFNQFDQIISTLSGGEKLKLAFIKILLQSPDLLILDEPTNHLDIPSKEVIETALINYKGSILFSSHDRYFIEKVASKILVLENRNLTTYPGNYSEYVERLNNNEKTNLNEKILLEYELNKVINDITRIGDPIEKDKLDQRYWEIVSELKRYSN